MIVKKYKEIKLDSKGRFLLPKRERTVFGESVIITTKKNCLLFLAEKEWNQMIEKNFAGLKGRELQRIQRILFGSAFLQTIDSQGKVLIPIQLRKEVRYENK